MQNQFKDVKSHKFEICLKKQTGMGWARLVCIAKIEFVCLKLGKADCV